jgi:cyclophilin family peptidyl-prolyl cis-trans isomerase
MTEYLGPEVDDTPLEFRARGLVSFPQVSEEMIASVALGMEEDTIVAARHGVSLEMWAELQAQAWFEQAVQVKRKELELEGVTLKYKARWMAGELLDKAYLMAASKDASFGQVHEALKTVVKLGNLEPKEEKGSGGGTTFSISIDLGEKSVSMTRMGESFVDVTDVPAKVIAR